MSVIGAALALGILSSAGTSMYLSNNKNTKPRTFGNRIKNFLTHPVSSKYRPRILKKIEDAIANPNQSAVKPKNAIEKFFAWLKTGHIIGTAWLSTTLTPFVLKFLNFDEDGILMKLSKINVVIAALGGIGTLAVTFFGKNDIIEGTKNIIDNLAKRFRFTKDKKVSDLSNGVERNELYRPIGRLIFPEGVKSRVRSLMKDSTIHGGALHAVGPPGNGKTSMAYAIAATSLEEDFQNKLDAMQVWVVDQSAMEGTLADEDDLGMLTKMLDGLSMSLGFGKVSGETITERVEMVIAHAVAHYKTTGEPVVILLDEAHEIFKLKGAKSSPESSLLDTIRGSKIDSQADTRTVDPNKRSRTLREFGALLEDKLKKPMCEGIILLGGSNIGQNEIPEHMRRRMPPITLHNPSREERISKLHEAVETWFTDPSLTQKISSLSKNQIDLSSVMNRLYELKNLSNSLLTPDTPSLAKIYDVGTVNLINIYFNGIDDEAISSGYINFLHDMKARDVLCFEHIDFAVRDAIHNFTSGGVDDFLKLVQKSLVDYTEETLQGKDAVLASVKYYQKVKLQGGQTQGVITPGSAELSTKYPELQDIFQKWLQDTFAPLVSFFRGISPVDDIGRKALQSAIDKLPSRPAV